MLPLKVVQLSLALPKLTVAGFLMPFIKASGMICEVLVDSCRHLVARRDIR